MLLLYTVAISLLLCVAGQSLDAAGDWRDAAGDRKDAAGVWRDAAGVWRDAAGVWRDAGDLRDAAGNRRDAAGDLRDAGNRRDAAGGWGDAAGDWRDAVGDARPSAKTNTRPIIGVLAQETSESAKHYGDTYIPAGYFKYLEMAGARAVPIFLKRRDCYYENIFKSINGVLFPGGAVSIIDSEFAKTARILYKAALKANDNGDYFPIWGTCLGFELLTALATGRDVLSTFDAEDLALPLYLSKGYNKSRLFGNLPGDVLYYLSKRNVTENFHQKGITPTTFQLTPALNQLYRVLSTNRDRKGKQFISTMEGIKYPIYGTQWHPEKPNYTWNTKYHINHGPDAVRVAQYVANFFVAEARKSSHRFSREKEEINTLIENYVPVYHRDATFEFRYYFNYTSSP